MRERQQPRFILLFGGPAAGKGTQARSLSQGLGLPHISSGELLRQDQSQPAAALLERGELAPDDLVSQIVFSRLQQPDAAAGAVLDGFPRNLTQARALDEWLARQGGKVGAAIFLEVPEEELIRRLVDRGEVSGRSDDRPQTAPRRLEVFKRDIPPVLDHYAKQGVLHNVAGAQSVENVQQHIARVLSARPIA